MADAAPNRGQRASVGQGVKSGVRKTVKISRALPGGAVKGVGKGVGNTAKFGVKATKNLTKGTVNVTRKGVKGTIAGTKGAAKLGAKGTIGAAKLGVKGTIGATKLGAKGTIGAAKLGVKGTIGATKLGVKGTIGATKLGVKGTLAGAKLGVKGTMAATKGTIGVTKLVTTTGVGLVTDFPGTAINLTGTGIKGLVGLPGTLTNLARRRVVRDDRIAWDVRVTSPIIKIDLQLECKRLPQKDSFANSDAFCVLWQVPNGYTGNSVNNDRPSSLPTRQEVEIGRTEVVRGATNPTFEHTFNMDFLFQEEQTYLVRVYDEDLKYATDLREHDYLGGAVFTLGQLMGAPGCCMVRPLGLGGSTKSQLFIMGREVDEAREVVALRFSAQDLLGVDGVLDKNDPYFKLERLEKDLRTWETIYKSEVIMDEELPTWAMVRIPLPEICEGDMFNQVKLTLWNWNKFVDDDPLGFVETTVRNLVHGSEHGIPVLNVYRENKKLFRSSKLKKAGLLKVLKAQIVKVPSMLQFVSGGCEIDLSIAVDCSIFNGDYTTEEGLHYRSNLWLNDYQAAIHKVGVIMESYSREKRFNIWGFGAMFPVDGRASIREEEKKEADGGKEVEEADADGDADEEEAQFEEKPIFNLGEGVGIGANGLLDAYDNFFGENANHIPAEHAILKSTFERAMYRAIELQRSRHSYGVLCILTAGNVFDIQDAIDTLCTASDDAPLSVIIIGVGQGGFETFKSFFEEGSPKLQHSNGVPISRDIAQFAAFSDFEENSSKVVSKALSGIPEQMVQYFINNGIKPQPALPVPDFSNVVHKSASKKKNHKRAKSSDI